MSQLLVWNEYYSVQNANMDVQHQRLFALVNRLYDALEQKRERDQLDDILAELVHYTQTHFRDEETLMAAHHFAGLEAHRAAHAALFAQLQGLLHRRAEGEPVMGDEVIAFLYDWLTQHILEMDKQYAELFSAPAGA